MTVKADVIIPTHDHANLLPMSIESACAQSVGDIRIVVIGDGVGDDTRAVMEQVLSRDDRVTFLDLPKAGRTGEIHRHPIITNSSAQIITYLGDDDLMFPDHVATMSELLDNADVAMPPMIHLMPDGSVACSSHSLSDPKWKSVACEGTSLFSLSGLSHTMEAYRKLPYGWRNTPEGYYTDQYMLLQYLEQDWCRFALAHKPTVINLASSLRVSMNPTQRFDELKSTQLWMAQGGWEEFRGLAFDSLRDQLSVSTFRLIEFSAALEQTHKVLAEVSAAAEQLRSEQSKLLATRTFRLRNTLINNQFVRFLAKLRRS